ncbi:MAG: T9SS type A sorting domain-containing protein, partial [Bacteroidales bacterium]|nr:T9SS type A sorting domain-containing protein [Bacteroidales bacterium]
ATEVFNCSVTGAVNANSYAGGAIGYVRNESKVTTININVEVTGVDNYIGGLVGYVSKASIDSSSASGAVTGKNYVGGAIGYISGGDTWVKNCFATGTVSGIEDYGGGFIGYISNGTTSECYATGSVSGVERIGGFIGRLSSGTVEKCYVTSSVTVSSFADAGGIVGENSSGSIIECYSEATVVSDSFNAGGIAGENSGGDIYNSYFNGSVSGKNKVGGIVGRNSGSSAEVKNCYAVCILSGVENTGALVGEQSSSSSFINCFWDKTVSGIISGEEGEGKTTHEMKSSSAFYNWDLMSVWSVDNNYPLLQWQDGVGTNLGDGSENNPYQITNVAELQAIQHDLSAHYIVMNHIDASETKNWNAGEGFTPLGDDATPFMGSLQGQGFTIDSLTINLPANNHVALFGKTREAEIGAVNATNVNITGYKYTGAIIGELDDVSELRNCSVTGNVAGYGYVGGVVGRMSDTSYAVSLISDVDIIATDNYVGGVVGYINRAILDSSTAKGMVTGVKYIGGTVGYLSTNAVIRNSSASGDVNAYNYVGGVVGYISDDEALAENCFSTGNTSANEYVGGFIGYISQGTVQGCYATGNVEGYERVGGIVGRSSNGVIEHCYTTSSVTVTAKLEAGGLAGENSSGTITSCYSSATVAVDSIKAGGLVGENYSGVISNSYFNGSVFAPLRTGGIVGNNNGSNANIEYCHAVGTIAGTDSIGGIVGECASDAKTYTACYWDTTSTGIKESDIGEAKSSSDMNQYATFNGWDFPTIWVMDSAYPILAWQQEAETDFEGGDGTKENPYQVSNVYQLQNMNNDKDAHYQIINDIDASETKHWNSGQGFEPVGNNPRTGGIAFSGSLNGGGFSIDSLYVNRSGSFAGLIGYAVDSAVIDSLHLINVDIYGGGDDVAGLVGLGYNVYISNCSVTGKVAGTYYVGGIVGEMNRGLIQSSSVKIKLEIGDEYAGGIAGYADVNSKLIDCSCDLEATGYNYLGGLVGVNHADIIRCNASGKINGEQTVGGLVGELRDGTISESYSTVSIEAMRNAGGLAGEVDDDGQILNCYVQTNKIYCSNNDAGGLIGTADASMIKNNYVVVDTIGATTNAGGIVGNNQGATILENYWDTTICNVKTTSGDGYPLSTEEMQAMDSYTEFSFPGIWCMDDSTEYPMLRWTAVEIQFSALENGSIKGGTLQYMLKGDTTNAVEALPNHHYAFANWNDGNVDNPRKLEGLMVDTSITAEFAFVNDIPEITEADTQYVAEDDSLTILLSMLTVEDTDDLLADTGIIILNGTNYTVIDYHVIPDANYNGDLTVPLAITDGYDISDTISMIINVTPVNDAPKITSLAGTTAIEKVEYVYEIQATDIDGDDLKYQLSGQPNGMIVENNIIKWIPESGVTTSGEVTLTVSDGELSDTETFTISVSINTGLNDVKTEIISIYPNPVSTTLIIQSEEVIKKVEIIAANGTVVAVQEAFENEVQLPVDNINNGLYLVKISTSKGTILRTVIKK